MYYSLRDYQQTAKDQLAEKIIEGKRKILLWLPTGTGKGLMMSDLVNDVLKANKSALTIMRRRSLVEQTKANYTKYHGNTPSVIMGNSKGYIHKHANQLASIDTLRTRMAMVEFDYLKHSRLIVIDECHDTGSPTYQRFFEKVEEVNPDAIFVGFTATPFTVGGKPLDHWEDYIQPITMAQVRDKGWLVRDVHYAPEARINTVGLKVEQGDFKEKDLFDRASESVIVGDIVSTWIKYGGPERPTIMFCVNKEHSKVMTAAFNLRGYKFVHVDESTTLAERAKIAKDLREKKIHGISNIETMTTGFDEPCISYVVDARPTWSEVLQVQKIGRAARPYKVCADCRMEYGAEEVCIRCKSPHTSFVKEDFIIMDHASNIERHGFFYDEREAKLKKLLNLEEQKKYTKSAHTAGKVFAIVRCDKCFIYTKPGQPCYGCNEVKISTELPKNEAGTMKLIDDATARKLRLNQILSQYQFLADKAERENWGKGKIYFVLHKKFGDLLFQFKEELSIPQWVEDKVNQQKEAKAANK